MNKIFSILALCFMAGMMSCGDESYQSDIPYTSFADVYINLDLPEYNSLAIDKGYYELDEGLRGIIIYRENSGSYKAYERNCPYHPYEACATVSVHSSKLYIFCPCCQSQFNSNNGYPMGGPAQYPLRQYGAYLSGRALTITDEVLN
ncbi:Rieske 2Fe-2S domain-containing protein [Fulvivirga ligni]|uniref:Rieske 2Fe-2S domain-containing protein n=1 Tax=Fulvivirga ligni TaxID=2904246 RepID=UPI001F18776E|nr:Rieske 2Fe-2S domain-containing protein [Fulvivirga ligni]UII22675.1 Rieske 2Fe-2S domain-containing protein [Fulvivirga ligni]